MTDETSDSKLNSNLISVNSTPPNPPKHLKVFIEKEMQDSYLSYAMSVIVGRALPDVRDGLKPVHRRVLFAMSQLGNEYNKPYKKSARVVGDVIGKFHPHGDNAVYDALVRMAQDFSLRYPLIDGQGNFGSIDGDNAAAMRYTEVRMKKITSKLLADIDQETVDFIDNYDGSESEPSVLPSRIPNLLINGSDGIAVGMATKIPPHNLTEVINALVALLNNPEIEIDELMSFIPGPDFPTAASINGASGIKEAYQTGRGSISMKSKTHFETYGKNDDRHAIIIDELPYQINKARLIERIANLVRDKKIESIASIRDESDKDGIRCVIELKRGEVPEVALNNLFKLTDLECSYGINFVCIVNKQPRLLNLKQILYYFLEHRKEVVTRRSVFELKKARNRTHILEGLALALENIDEMIALIKKASDPKIAKQELLDRTWPTDLIITMLSKKGQGTSQSDLFKYRPDWLDANLGLQKTGEYQLSENQASAILDLRLHRLTSLEREKIINEFNDLINKMDELIEIITNSEKLKQTIEGELIDIKEQFDEKRRTSIVIDRQSLENEDLIANEKQVVTLSNQGYIKTQSLDSYSAQHRGGRGKFATHTKEEDHIHTMLVANSHDMLLCFSNLGKVYWVKTYQLPTGSNQSKGRPVNNLIDIQENEFITTILAIENFKKDQYVFLATSNAQAVKISLEKFSRPRSAGIIAIDIKKNHSLIDAKLVEANDTIMLFSAHGRCIHFKQSDVRATGRGAKGVRAMRLSIKDLIVSMIINKADQEEKKEHLSVMTATSNGYGKKTLISEYNVQKRGGSGVISIKTSGRNGNVVGSIIVNESDDVLLISNQGVLIRTKVNSISIIGRNTQGVRLIKLAYGTNLSAIAHVTSLDENQLTDL